jgi:hypothetical protein
MVLMVLSLSKAWTSCVMICVYKIKHEAATKFKFRWRHFKESIREYHLCQNKIALMVRPHFNVHKF